MLPSNVIKSWALKNKVPVYTYMQLGAMGARTGHTGLPTPPTLLNWQGMRNLNSWRKLRMSTGKAKYGSSTSSGLANR